MDEPLGKTQVVTDFLPSPSELAFREEGVKVTLALSKKSIEFFKSEATKHHTQYQRMIRRLSSTLEGLSMTRALFVLALMALTTSAIGAESETFGAFLIRLQRTMMDSSVAYCKAEVPSLSHALDASRKHFRYIVNEASKPLLKKLGREGVLSKSMPTNEKPPTSPDQVMIDSLKKMGPAAIACPKLIRQMNNVTVPEFRQIIETEFNRFVALSKHEAQYNKR